MKPIEFEGFNIILAKDQPQYLPLPVFLNRKSREGEVVSCWQLTMKERFKILFTGILWLSQWTFFRPLQPIRPSVESPMEEGKGCKHTKTHYEGWPDDGEIEVCEACGMSRYHWENGETDWIMIENIQKSREDLQKFLNDEAIKKEKQQ